MAGEELREVASEEEPALPKERDWEAEARKAGWNPKGELGARDYVVTKPLRDKLHDLSRKVRDQDAAIARQEKLHRERIEAQVQARLAELEREQAKAIKAGDSDAAVRLGREIRQEEKKADEAKRESPPPEDRTFETWKEENGWYGSNRNMRAWADGIGPQIRKEEGLSGRALLDRVTEEARKAFPDAFTEKKRAPKVESGDDSPHGYGDRGREEVGWEDIPKDVRPIFESLWKQGTWKSKDGKILPKPAAARIYAKDYL